MSIFSINSNCVPLKAYLRADSHSQCFQYSNKSGELVTKEMFWGNAQNEGLYLDYHLINNRRIDVSVGISEITAIETKHNEDCDQWISENLYDSYHALHEGIIFFRILPFSALLGSLIT